MKSILVARYIGGALVALTALTAYAQGGSEAASAPLASAAPGSSAARTANRQLQKQVRRALAHTKGLATSGIAVRARDGVVTLQGWVPAQSQVALALSTAQGVPGVTAVNNQLIVRPVGQ